MNHEQDLIESVSKPILWLGLLLILLGSGALIYVAITTVQIIENPSQVELVKWLLSSIKESGLLLSGELNNIPFEIEASDALQYVFLGIIGLVMVGILASVINSIISGGIKLVMFSQQQRKEPKEQGQSNAIRQTRR
ncbi:MAG: hypothetical protein P8166_06395 [Candidatus Thiodiazotropha sp.]|jgi:disulfide bond formation protein DsbB